MENLADYMDKGHPHDMWHTLFPGVLWQKMQEEWDSVAVTGAPEIVRILYNHIKSLKVPGYMEMSNIRLFPEGYGRTVAGVIDEILPHWNIPQKTILWVSVMREVYVLAGQAWSLRCAGQPMPPTPGERAGDDILSQVLGKPE